jgi:hypothetical protein
MPRMPYRFFFSSSLHAWLLAPLLAMSVVHGAAAQSAALATIELSAGIHLIHAELADNDSARMRGLMYRQALAPNHGMLFIFDETDRHCMWMRNTLLPLAVAFIDNVGEFVKFVVLF